MTSNLPEHPLFAEAVRAIAQGDVSEPKQLLDLAPELARTTSTPPSNATLLH